MTLVVLLLLLFPSPVVSQQDPATLEQELYQALQAGTPARDMEHLCRRIIRLLPQHAYPRLVLADTLFKLRRLQGAVESYDLVLQLTGPADRLAVTARQNRALAAQQLEEIKRGRNLAGRAVVTGWVLLALLVGAVLVLAWKY